MNPPPRQIRDRQQRACQLPGWHPGESGTFSALARILLLGFGGQVALGMGDPYSFQSNRRRGDRRLVHPRQPWPLRRHRRRLHQSGCAGQPTQAMEMPEYGRSIIYGVIFLLLLLHGREAAEQ
jgi:ribose transport system permease protein